MLFRSGATQLYLIAYAAIFLLIMLLMPRGILPSLSERLRKRTAARVPREAEAPVAAAPKEMVP